MKTFNYENISFSYELFLEKRKTISASVLPNGNLVVKAPEHAELSKIEKFLKRKTPWILEQKRFFKQFKEQTEKEYVSGETLLYFGRQYKLLIEKSSLKEYVSLEKGIIKIYTLFPNDSNRSKDILNTWLESRVNSIFKECFNTCLKDFDYNPKPTFAVRKLRKRWGSYLGKSKILLNPDLIHASKKEITYIITHELCHLTHKNHTKEFFKLLESKFPKWKATHEKMELHFFQV